MSYRFDEAIPKHILPIISYVFNAELAMRNLNAKLTAAEDKLAELEPAITRQELFSEIECKILNWAEDAAYKHCTHSNEIVKSFLDPDFTYEEFLNEKVVHTLTENVMTIDEFKQYYHKHLKADEQAVRILFKSSIPESKD